MNSYFTIYSSEGDLRVSKLTKNELEEMINDIGMDYYFVNDINNGDPAYWTNGSLLIIKGEIITPITKKWGIK